MMLLQCMKYISRLKFVFCLPNTSDKYGTLTSYERAIVDVMKDVQDGDDIGIREEITLDWLSKIVTGWYF